MEITEGEHIVKKYADNCVDILGKAEEPLFDEKRYECYISSKREEMFYDDKLLRLLVLGRFKAGKSSLINAIVGEKVAAVDALEKTAWIARYWPADDDFCNLIFKDGTVEKTEISLFLKKTENDEWSDEYLSQIHRIDVGCKKNRLSYGIIDTPGFGSTNEDNEKRAIEAINDADMILYVIDVNKIGNQRENAIMSTIRESGIPLICVANKYDGDIAHHKSPEDTISMVSKYTEIDPKNIYLMSSKLYEKNKDSAIEQMNKLLQRINRAEVINSELRKKAKAASRKRFFSEELKLLLQAENELCTINRARLQVEDNYVYTQHLVETELVSYLKSYVKETLYDGYKDEILEEMNKISEASENEKKSPDFSKAVDNVLPKDYMDKYWNKVKAEACNKCSELWHRQQENYQGEIAELNEDLKKAGINISFGTGKLEAYNNPDFDAALSDKIIGTTFRAAGFAGFCALVFGASFSGALMLAAPIAIFGLLLNGSLKSKVNGNKENISQEEILNDGINKFADMISKYAINGLSKNETEVLNKRLEMFDKEAAKRLPPSYKLCDVQNMVEDNISLMRENTVETDDIKLLKQSLEQQKAEINRLEASINKVKKQNERNVKASKSGQVSSSEALLKLNDMIGLDSVKDNVQTVINSIIMQKRKETAGLHNQKKTYHLVFTGNPGTGKTEVARLIGEIYKELGIVKKGQFIEVDRSGLVAEYVGQTAVKTLEKCKEALGGILFIDEAYKLAEGGKEDFGTEAIDTVLKFMEDNRDDIVVIAAGYKDRMKSFIGSNPGLESRFKTFIDFPDYNPDELVLIFNKFCTDVGYHLEKETLPFLNEYMRYIYENRDENFANARTVRNYYEDCIQCQDNRLIDFNQNNTQELKTLTLTDLKNAAKLS